MKQQLALRNYVRAAALQTLKMSQNESYQKDKVGLVTQIIKNINSGLKVIKLLEEDRYKPL